MTPKKWAGESMAGSETMIMAITIGVEILWRAGSSPRGAQWLLQMKEKI